MAPPDAGLRACLGQLAEAARAEALACRAAHEAGSEWPPHRAASSDPPFELRPGSGRRGPEEAWRRSDVAVSELNRSATGTDLMLQVADAYGNSPTWRASLRRRSRAKTARRVCCHALAARRSRATRAALVRRPLARATRAALVRAAARHRPRPTLPRRRAAAAPRQESLSLVPGVAAGRERAAVGARPFQERVDVLGADAERSTDADGR